MRRLYLIIGALLAVGCSSQTVSIEEEAPFRLLFWNIQNGMWAEQGKNYDSFVNWVREQNPDVCVWCEARSIYYTGTRDKLPLEEKYLVDNWPELAARYGHRFVYVGGMRDNYPQVITSKTPIHGMAKIVGEEPDSVVTHGAVWAQVSVADKTLNLVALHTWPHPYAFNATDQEASKAAHGGESQGDPVTAKERRLLCHRKVPPFRIVVPL